MGRHVKYQQILDFVREVGILRVRDLAERGIHSEYLRRLYKKGLVKRVGRGLYMLPDAEISVHHTLALASKWAPRGVICLLSALQFHEIGAQMPFEVWMALDRNAAAPRIDYPPMRIMRFSGKSLDEGVEIHFLEGVEVKVYCPAKTVVDCFKYRNKIGLDVALEGLKECLRERRCTNDDLWRYARICRVANVMRPYLEAMS